VPGPFKNGSYPPNPALHPEAALPECRNCYRAEDGPVNWQPERVRTLPSFIKDMETAKKRTRLTTNAAGNRVGEAQDADRPTAAGSVVRRDRTQTLLWPLLDVRL
jgi:hypothetical protein